MRVARKLVEKIDVGNDCSDVAVGFGSVWVAGGSDSSLVRIDPNLGRRETIPLPTTADPNWGSRSTGSQREPEALGDARPLSAADRPCGQSPDLVRTTLGPRAQGGRRAILCLGGNRTPREPSAPVRCPGSAVPGRTSSRWSVSPVARRIRPRRTTCGSSSTVAGGPALRPGGVTGRIAVDQYPLAVALGAGAAWVVNPRGLWRLNPGLTTVQKRIATAPTSRSSLAVGYGSVWVAIQHGT